MKKDEIKLPAIRSKMGIWVYYISSLSFNQVLKYVSPINDELHKSELLSQMIQRSITENYKNIANYLISQEERFFNALILAVYDGEPIWNEIRIEDENGQDNYDLGVLTLSGQEKIFPVDGQHRVAGIKEALELNQNIGEERVPVIFIGHLLDVEVKTASRLLSNACLKWRKGSRKVLSRQSGMLHRKENCRSGRKQRRTRSEPTGFAWLAVQ